MIHASFLAGDWDLKTMLPRQMELIGKTVPPHFNTWANVKKVFRVSEEGREAEKQAFCVVVFY